MNGNGDDNLEYDDLPGGEWIHHAVVKTGDQLVYYRNGVEASSGTITQPLDGPMPLFFGGDNTGMSGENWRGMLSDIRIYERALNEDEVAELAARPKAYAPRPANGNMAVLTPLLQWEAGTSAFWHDVYLGTSPELTAADQVATRTPMNLYFHLAGLVPGTVYYWRVDEIEVDGTVHTGDVWTFTAQDLVAYAPDPADGQTDVSPAVVLNWQPGQSVTAHDVYLSENVQEVEGDVEAADQGTVEEATFDPNGLTELTTYYWRVDETALSGEIRPGAVWTFTTYLPVDDFESYTDNMDAVEAIFQTWIDGVENGTGSVVGYFNSQNGTFGETTIVHGGLQSMPLDYNNVNPPHYSETEREFSSTQDWTVGGVDALILSVAGRPTNVAAPLYVAVEDAAGQSAVAVHPDPMITASPKWSDWRIPLSELGGIDTGRIEKVIIGLGDRDNPTAGGAGLIYIDDIRLTTPAAGG
jgi:hypothetical protein